MNPLIVYKLGGSLLDLSDLADRLRRIWLERPGTMPLLIVGGGPAADVVRAWDRTFQFGDEVAHWLAIDALDLSANLLLRLMPELQLVRSQGQLDLARESGRPALLCVACFMKWLDRQPDPLPHTWSVTSDSVAAAVAAHWQAEDLVLLKSCDLPDEHHLEDLARCQVVDDYFPIAARLIKRLTWVNLRTLVERGVSHVARRSYPPCPPL